MCGPHELGAQQIERDGVKGEAEHEAVAFVPCSDRHAQILDVELSGEVLDWAVVGCDTTDT